MRIGCHDPFSTDHRVVLKIRGNTHDTSFNFLNLQLHADHAGRAHQHAIGRRADFRRRRSTHPPRILHPLRTGGHIAALAVRHDRTQPAGANGLASQNDRRAGKMVPREHRRRIRLNLAHKERQVARRRFESNVTARAPEAARKNSRSVKHGCTGLMRSVRSATQQCAGEREEDSAFFNRARQGSDICTICKAGPHQSVRARFFTPFHKRIIGRRSGRSSS